MRLMLSAVLTLLSAFSSASGTTGRAQMWTFKALRSTHPDFTESVRAVLPLMRFYPAVLRGQKVKQLVQMPFVFGLNR